jgi:hypothetical protein
MRMHRLPFDRQRESKSPRVLRQLQLRENSEVFCYEVIEAVDISFP